MYELSINLDEPPEHRWQGLAELRDPVTELMAFYSTDLGNVGLPSDMLAATVDALLPAHLATELRSIATALDLPMADLALANLYYDAMKQILGCTAFALDGEEGPLHARNLDWWSPGTALSDHTLLATFTRGGTTLYQTIGWPGFIGAFSGVAPGRFAVTLNAVVSGERPRGGLSAPAVVRGTLEQAVDYDEAVAMLSETPLASDCILLVTGKRSGEAIVIERTPSRHAHRGLEDGFIVATNDYRELQGLRDATGMGALSATACGRFDATSLLLLDEPPSNSSDCFRILTNEHVQMGITVQQMVFHARTGVVLFRTPQHEG